MSKLKEFFEEISTDLEKELGKVDYFGSPSAAEEASWTIWNRKRYTEVINAQMWVFMPEKKDYRLMFSILGEDTVGLQYIEVMEEGKGTGTTILNIILDAADKYGITIDVFASPFKCKYGNVPVGKLKRFMYKSMMKDTLRLINWYRDFDFVSTNKKEPFRMQYKITKKLVA